MSDLNEKLLKELIDRRRPGYSLEAPFYLSEAVFKADMKHIFGKHWIFVAIEPQVAEAGDYITVDVGHESILIVRDDDMQLQAFFNVCRHRGSRLCADKQGIVGNIVCPYHQWTYDLSGKLLHAKHMGDSFDVKDHNLKPVHIRSMSGLIFICLAAEAPTDFDEVAARMKPYLDPHDLANCKIAATSEIIEHCNWKLTMENNRECYHCMSNHPELTASIFEYGFGYQPDPANREGIDRFASIVASNCERWEGMGLASVEIDNLDSRVTGFRTQRLPLDGAGESETLDSKVAVKKLLADFKDPALGALSFWTQPNSWHHFMSDHIITFTVLPISADRTLVRTTWCVNKDAVEGVDYDVENLKAVWEATNAQDRKLVEEAHMGVMNGAYEPGPYSPFTEELVEKFCNWYVERLRLAIAS